MLSDLDLNRAERLARGICLGAGEDPDMVVYPGIPYQARHGFCTAGIEPMANWRTYLRQAYAALQLFDEFLDEAGKTQFDWSRLPMVEA